MPNDATDIVKRLRDTTAGYTVQTVFDEAADEIERLRNDATRMRGAVLRLTSEMEILRERLETARRMGGGCAREQLASAINERDLAREMLRLEREECAACAIDRKETQRERDLAREQLASAINERDLARGEVCRLLARSSKRDPDYWGYIAVAEYPTPQEVAESREWDLYRKDGTNGK